MSDTIKVEFSPQEVQAIMQMMEVALKAAGGKAVGPYTMVSNKFRASIEQVNAKPADEDSAEF